MYQSVVKSALPSLCDAIAKATADESWITSSAIDLVTSIENGAPTDGLGEGFFAALAPSLFACLRVSEDRDVLQVSKLLDPRVTRTKTMLGDQNGVACLTMAIRKDCNQLLAWRDAQGQSGIDNVLAVIAKLLGNEDESGGLVVGDLIIHLLRRASSAVLTVLPDLLQAMVRRMVTAKTASFVQVRAPLRGS